MIIAAAARHLTRREEPDREKCEGMVRGFMVGMVL
jgi:hypothetical protein